MPDRTDHAPVAWRRGRRGRVRWATLVLGALLLLGASACAARDGDDRVATLSGSSNQQGKAKPSQPEGKKEFDQAALEFARCMRQHGVDMPDPSVDGQGGLQMRIGGRGVDPKRMQAAEQACRQLLPDGGPGAGPGGQLDPKVQEAMLAYARCMRAEGIDMPDPGSNGLLMRRGAGGEDPASPKFRTAHQTCRHHMAEIDRQLEQEAPS